MGSPGRGLSDCPLDLAKRIKENNSRSGARKVKGGFNMASRFSLRLAKCPGPSSGPSRPRSSGLKV